MGLGRFMMAMVAGLVANGAAVAAAEMVLGGYALPGALAGASLGAFVAFRINEANGNAGPFEPRRLRATIVIAFAFALAIHLTMVLRLGGLRPLASFTLCAVAALLFAVIGYWRFFKRG